MSILSKIKELEYRDRKKSVITIVLVLIILVYGLYGVSKYFYETKKDDYIKQQLYNQDLDVKIHIETKTIANYSLGNEIYKHYYYNNKEVHDGDIVKARKTMTFRVEIIEDDSIPDVGSMTTSIHLPSNYVTSCRIEVDEEGGRRYQGYGIFSTTIKVEPLLNTYWKVVFS